MSAVRALKSLQKDIIFSPACPSAGPTGGAGFAWPAGTSSRTIDLTALVDMRPHCQRRCQRRYSCCRCRCSCRSRFRRTFWASA